VQQQIPVRILETKVISKPGIKPINF